ncbi:MAG: T9SS type A sorting domain-containing protein [Flavobacteriales bacterium]|nr:T9SS type A sorting domain-containing protein [Flavobacteriales bacterium]
MKVLTTVFVSLLLVLNAQSQNSPIDFEPGGFGFDWTWTVFENQDNPALEIIDNPDATGANTSSTVAKFTARANGAPFAGCESEHGVDLGVYTLSSDNSTVSIMVWKSNISDVGIKLVTTSGGALIELKIANSVVNQWEQLTFDFTDYIDNAIYAIEDVDQIVVFPDFEDRNEDRIIYFDNITISPQGATGLEELDSVDLQVYPNPTSDFITVSSDKKIDGIRILNSLGQLVLEQNVQMTRGEIDLRSLIPGNYHVEAQLGDVVSRSSVIVK